MSEAAIKMDISDIKRPPRKTDEELAVLRGTMVGKDPYSIPLEDIDVAQPEIFQDFTMWGFFDRLRKEDPVHYCRDSEFGPYWSVTKYNDIMAVDTNHHVFSSDAHLGGITVGDPDDDFILPMFIAMDPPKHDAQRKVVSPIPPISPFSKARSANAPSASSTPCPRARNSTGSITSPSNSPRRCWRRCSTSPGKIAAS